MKRTGWAAALACAARMLVSNRAEAEDLFEIQVFHARVVPEGHAAVEVHSNYAAQGSSAQPAAPEASTNRMLHEMVEPSFGVAKNWEIGGHLQQAFRPDGTYVWGGAKLRTMFLFTPPEKLPDEQLDLRGHWHFGLNVEGGYQPERFDPARFSAEIRPVVEWNQGMFDVDVNPIVGVPLGGNDHAGVPHLEPCASARVAFVHAVQPSVEYYADFGPVSAMPRVRDQRHYAYATVDFFFPAGFFAHAGVGEGLTPASSRWVVTSIVGKVF